MFKAMRRRARALAEMLGCRGIGAQAAAELAMYAMGGVL